MNRRGFLKLLGMGVVAMTLSPLVAPATGSTSMVFTTRDLFPIGTIFNVAGLEPTYQVTGYMDGAMTVVQLPEHSL